MLHQKIIVGISGGVDSSVAAMLLKERGYQVEALFMKNWGERDPDSNCPWEADVEDAMQVCDTLDIRLNTIDLSQEYWHEVFTGFVKEYQRGRTPNPDVLCNQEIKFKAFLDHALASGADMIATGHYARIEQRDKLFRLYKGYDTNKDQSYFLCRLTQSQLACSIFPLGKLTKSQVRDIAASAGLVTHSKKDSTGICFIGERPFKEFLSRYIPIKKGNIVNIKGEKIGEHDGVFFYTLGQRQGLGIGGVRDANEEPWYVVAKDTDRNLLVVAQGHDNPLLFSSRLKATTIHWISEIAPAMPLNCFAKTRYRQPDQACTIESLNKDSADIIFKQPQRAVTPGQYVVFYDGDNCLGSGLIDTTN